MSANTSAKTEDLKGAIIAHALFVVEGLSLVFTCGLLALIIIKHKALRKKKEFFIIGAQAFADCFCGLGTLSAGIRRLPMFLYGGHDTPASMIRCFFTPHSLLWFFFLPAQNFMFVIVSLDRFISVVWPIKYIQYNVKYAHKMVGVAYGLALAMWLNALQSAARHTSDLDQQIVCHGNMAKEQYCEVMDRYLNVGASVSSVVLYAVIPIVYRRRNLVLDKEDEATKKKLTYQGKLTKTTGINCTCTFLLVVLPWLASLVTISVESLNEYYILINDVAFFIANINPMLNLFIYVTKQKEVKMGLKNINKEMPPVTQLWK